MRRFRDREDAGRQLAEALTALRDENPVVLGLPRGGVPVAYEVARTLEAPLDVVVVRKLGVPFQPELGMGAVGEEGARVINQSVVHMAGVTDEELGKVESRERAEVEARARRFRGDQPPVSISGRTAIVVDDGIATGGTARAALRVVRARGAARVVLAVPVAPVDVIEALEMEADEAICLMAPPEFFAIGQWYADFVQVPDTQVVELLHRAAEEFADMAGTPATTGGPAAPDDPPLLRDDEVEVTLDGRVLPGHLTVPANALGLVIFVHGSGSSRHSPRNRSVARELHDAGLGTLLFDLLTENEAYDRANVFDIQLLARRLTAATTWLRGENEGRTRPIGYFGASTGAAAALRAAAEPEAPISAIVSRGGRPDLAAPRLEDVRAPTLLIVGGDDHAVLDLNRQAAASLRCEHHIEIVRGATHLFEEPGALEAVSALARDWFVGHFVETVHLAPVSKPSRSP
jgi:putative phosphoribosyl transferase